MRLHTPNTLFFNIFIELFSVLSTYELFFLQRKHRLTENLSILYEMPYKLYINKHNLPPCVTFFNVQLSYNSL